MKIHLIAIGGSAMHNLALALQQAGHTVSGSDDEIFEPSLSRLKNASLLPPEIGWFPDRISADLDLVILGMHARADNPELARARELGIQVLSYPEYLYEHSKNKTRVVIAGSHGKTTVTSMVMHVCRAAGLDFDYLVGAQVKGFDTMVRLSNSAEFMLIEGDEYPASALQLVPKFHFYRPNITAITGIAWDHANVFPTEEVYVEQFRKYMQQCEPGASVIYFAEDDKLKNVVESTQNFVKKVPYFTPPYEVRSGVFHLLTEDGLLPVSVIGRHNMANLEAARWVCQLMGIQEREFYEAITSFEGAAKRLQLLGSNHHTQVYLDFAHAPSKVKATLDAIKESFPEKKIIAVLELHTYSSLSKSFLPNYAHALDAADVPMVYFNPKAVAHKRLPELKREDVAEAFGIAVSNFYSDASEVLEKLKSMEISDTIFLIMTSGNFDGVDLKRWADQLLDR
ncbi:peptidoglycan synthetase [Thermaurantimonas aggregans]|uniref:Peptidoglycan synthetase n=1 Tax=Thermaurantimonas aggregans TaxID=2173829 RepID=A0A401XL21_9FLAO|nr:Mur ligase family protein [Thermaurantimonas aggregans]MCX8149696.1 Mur ligase family protein [Thermaurantimonas aggregans]GCD77735.1 peptidoglycan synthetase [Thermaurantimonas aggregans]